MSMAWPDRLYPGTPEHALQRRIIPHAQATGQGCIQSWRSSHGLPALPSTAHRTCGTARRAQADSSEGPCLGDFPVFLQGYFRRHVASFARRDGDADRLASERRAELQSGAGTPGAPRAARSSSGSRCPGRPPGRESRRSLPGWPPSMGPNGPGGCAISIATCSSIRT
jgi:hypothetical protein